MATLDLSIAVDSDDEVRALYQALCRAETSEYSEASRLRSLRATGYLSNSADTAAEEQRRAEVRASVCRWLSISVKAWMNDRDIRPW